MITGRRTGEVPVESHKNTVPQPHVDEGSEFYETNWSDDGNCRPTGMTPQSVGPPGARAAAAQPSSGNTGMGERGAIETPATPLGRVVGSTFPFGGAAILKLFLAVSGINWFFMILATALSQLDVVGGGCYTFWGFKSSCDTVSYTRRTQLLSCKGYIRPLQTGAAFSIFSILLMTAALFFNFKVLMSCRAKQRARGDARTSTNEREQRDQQQKRDLAVSPFSKWRIVGLSAVALFCELVCWAMTVSVYASRPCENKTMPRSTTYGAGFGLMMTGWTVEVVALALFALTV
ncbi:amastin, putative [Trypanosoma cruzi marinkellei]|uniref:Amastin, putative n=1 Tax=Trypanosoma cruzi marinkellei TaxID=85056 RepID=K2NGY8_TRYCR|nr:amastin, putative [Trypanosoma cruzi marinkellei]